MTVKGMVAGGRPKKKGVGGSDYFARNSVVAIAIQSAIIVFTTKQVVGFIAHERAIVGQRTAPRQAIDRAVLGRIFIDASVCQVRAVTPNLETLSPTIERKNAIACLYVDPDVAVVLIGRCGAALGSSLRKL